MVICLTKLLIHEKRQLSKIWLAAHWEKKLKRTQVFEVDIEKSVQEIMDYELTLDLRLSGHLLIGIVRIHSQKTRYLLNECSSIFYQVRIFQEDRIDLPVNKQTAAVKAITLTEFFSDNFDNIGNDVIDDILSSNQSRVEDITLKETVTDKLTLLDDDDMMSFEFREEDEPFDFTDENLLSMYDDLEIPTAKQNAAAPKIKTAVYQQINIIKIVEQERIDELPILTGELDLENSNSDFAVNEVPDLSSMVNRDRDHAFSENSGISSIQSNKKSFVKLTLDPLQISSRNSAKNNSRKRKLCIDSIKCLSEEDIQKQVLDTSDIISVFNMAPASKRLMTLKDIGCAKQLFCLPGLKLQNPQLLKYKEKILKLNL